MSFSVFNVEVTIPYTIYKNLKNKLSFEKEIYKTKIV